MAEQIGGDRRIEAINDLRERVIRLEINHEDLVLSKINHAETIDKLSVRDGEMAIALTAISVGLTALKDQIAQGIKLIAGSFTISATLIGAYWIYSHDLDEKYQPKLENAERVNDGQTSALLESTESINEQLEKLNIVQQELKKLKDKKVIKASK